MPDPIVPKSFSIDISQSLIFCLVFVGMAVLVGFGKLPAEKLEYLLLVLIPSPIKTKLDGGVAQ